jgi:hypothetical protein
MEIIPPEYLVVSGMMMADIPGLTGDDEDYDDWGDSEVGDLDDYSDSDEEQKLPFAISFP